MNETSSDEKRSQELEYLLAGRDAELEQTRDSLVAARSQAAALQEQLDASNRRLAESAATIKERDRRISGMEASAGWRLSVLGRRVVHAPENAVRYVGRRLIPERRRNRLVRRYPWLRRRHARDDQPPAPLAAPATPPPISAAPVVAPLQPIVQPHSGYDVIYLAVIEWQFRFQRPQQIATQFAEHGHRVFYVNPIKLLSGSDGHSYSSYPLAANLWDVRLAASRRPMIYREVLDPGSVRDMATGLDALRREQGINDAVIIVEFPSWTPLALELKQRFGWKVVYDCMDEWQNFEGVQKPALHMEEELARASDLLAVSGRRLLEKWQGYNERTLLVRNGVNPEFFARGCKPNDVLKDMAHPIIGYFGAIASWFDVQLLHDVASARPQWSFVLLGGVFDVDAGPLQALPNVHLLGNQAHDLIPQYLYHFDACIIPFVINRITAATDPVKFYEYMSAGKPVVSVRLPELMQYEDYVYFAGDAAEFTSQLAAALKESDPALLRRRRLLAQANSWRDRYATLDTAISGLYAKASLVIVTYNNAGLTQQCIESIYRNASYPSFEVIVVDNASTDSTRAFLSYAAAAYPTLRVILSAENEGFASACNRGLSAASGSYIVFLNNDVVTPPGWLGRLLRHLDDAAIGLVGPVTNSAGNEAKIATAYQNMAEMETFAAAYSEEHSGQVFDIRTLALFCTAARRALLDEIGPLDEQFEVGMFEDDDLSQRVRRAGYRVVCAEDVFVHHAGEAAFGKLPEAEYKRIFEANRARYERKWQTTWQWHTGRAVASEAADH